MIQIRCRKCLLCRNSWLFISWFRYDSSKQSQQH